MPSNPPRREFIYQNAARILGAGAMSGTWLYSLLNRPHSTPPPLSAPLPRPLCTTPAPRIPQVMKLPWRLRMSKLSKWKIDFHTLKVAECTCVCVYYVCVSVCVSGIQFPLRRISHLRISYFRWYFILLCWQRWRETIAADDDDDDAPLLLLLYGFCIHMYA